jgi:hypothetical protein
MLVNKLSLLEYVQKLPVEGDPVKAVLEVGLKDSESVCNIFVAEFI